MKYDYLIIGSGFFGSVCARELTDDGKKCLVIDKKKHIGGNCYTDNNLKLYQKYKNLTLNTKNVIFGGRLAEYKYYDMHHVIENALNTINYKYNQL